MRERHIHPHGEIRGSEPTRDPARKRGVSVTTIRRLSGASALILVLAAPPSTFASGKNATTTLASQSSRGKQATSGSGYASISANGRYVAFETSARLAGREANGIESDVFVRDRVAQKTKRVSVSSAGESGTAWSGYASISGDGNVVAFTSPASNLVPGDRNGREDVFVRDCVNRKTERVSVSSTGEEGNADSAYTSTSADGRFVAFTSAATNLVAGDTNGQIDLFLRDRSAGRTTRISKGFGGDQANEDIEYLVPNAMSADGRYVAFNSMASNLVPGDTNGQRDVFVHDRETGLITRASVGTSGAEGDSGSDYGAMSADGRFVVFESLASTLVDGDHNQSVDVFVHELKTGKTTRVSVSPTGEEGDGDSRNATISANGRFVAFDSYATNIIAKDENDNTDVFVRDLKRETTRRISRSVDGGGGNDESEFPLLSADGRFVVFQSDATNLVAGDTNGLDDVFVRGPLR